MDIPTYTGKNIYLKCFPPWYFRIRVCKGQFFENKYIGSFCFCFFKDDDGDGDDDEAWSTREVPFLL